MEIINQSSVRSDNALLAITHLSQLLNYASGFVGFIVPLIIWFNSKNTVEGMDTHGKSIINFQLSMLLYFVICVPAILLFGLGLLGFLAIGLISFIMPIVNAVKASRGEAPSNFMTIAFI